MPFPFDAELHAGFVPVSVAKGKRQAVRAFLADVQITAVLPLEEAEAVAGLDEAFGEELPLARVGLVVRPGVDVPVLVEAEPVYLAMEQGLARFIFEADFLHAVDVARPVHVIVRPDGQPDAPPGLDRGLEHGSALRVVRDVPRLLAAFPVHHAFALHRDGHDGEQPRRARVFYQVLIIR